jgi:uncharacterized membrane protein
MNGRALRITMLVLATVGLGVASYLTYVHYAGIKPACTAGESCTKVQTSIYSELAGVPVALLGLIGYVAILASLLVPAGETSRFVTVALTLGGLGFSAYLTYRELFSIHAICEWCVSSAVIMTMLTCLALWRFLRGEDDLKMRPPRMADDRAQTAATDAEIAEGRPTS